MTSLSQKALLVHFSHLMALTVLSTSAYVPASSSICSTVKGAVPSNSLPTWSIPVYATGTNATLNVMAASDFYINLHQNNTQYPPPFTGYQFLVGGWSNSRSEIRTIQTPVGIGPDAQLAYYLGVVLNANSYKPIWISWTNGFIAIGTGSVVGLNGLMNYTSNSPEPVNYMLIGSLSSGSTFFLTYCFNQRFIYQSLPVNAPVKVISMPTALECGRACADDPNCQGYAMYRKDVTVTACSIYYSIPMLMFDEDHVTYLVRIAQLPTFAGTTNLSEQPDDDD